VLDGPTLMIYSDYSGNSRDSRFETISLLFVDLRAASVWDSLRTSVRQQFLPDGRRMGFKGLNDSYKRRGLSWFLRAADHLHGSSASSRSISASEKCVRVTTRPQSLSPEAFFNPSGARNQSSECYASLTL